MIKNYTSQVPINRSTQHIEDQLVRHDAKNILKLYENKRLIGIAFILSINEKDMPFRLPARLDRVEKRLRELLVKPHTTPGTIAKIKEQSERTAWKLLSDWVDIQMSLIELDQVELIEVFMPYLYDVAKDQTFFEKMKAEGFAMLAAPKKS